MKKYGKISTLSSKKIMSKEKRFNLLVLITQISIVVIFLLLWEMLARFGVINTFIFSSPSLIAKTIKDLFLTGNLLSHLMTTFIETAIAFVLGIVLGLIVAIILYSWKFLAKVIDPFLTLINSLPKVALGPILIIWIGANTKSIIVMALLINLIVSIVTIYNGFLNIDANKIKLLKSFGATKGQILRKLIIPASYQTIVSSLKLNISMSLIGVIMGEFLVSKEGLGYLIMYGTQVFNLNLVMSGIFLLLIFSYILYKVISLLEKKLIKE